jgi:hypothetical protein
MRSKFFVCNDRCGFSDLILNKENSGGRPEDAAADPTGSTYQECK